MLSNKLTKQQKSFIGSVFPTPKGGELTVTGVSEQRQGNHCLYTLKCSLCKDEDIFNEDFILARKSFLEKGYIPCGCSKNFRPNKKQIEIIKSKALFKLKRAGITLIGEPDIFTGEIFHTNHGVLTVLGHNTLKGSDRKYYVNCSRCSKDTELFPEYSIQISKVNLLKGSVPCGCSTNHKYKEWQYEILVKRKCKEKGYEFIGWSGEWLDRCTNITLYNRNTDNVWSTAKIYTLLRGDSDPVESRIIASEKTRKNILTVEEEITDIFSKEVIKFIGWVDSFGYKNIYSKLKWSCKEGHICESTYYDFCKRGTRCKKCFQLNSPANGYLESRSSEEDYLYIIEVSLEDCNYIKVGRSFYPEERFKQISRELKRKGLENKITLCKLFTGRHSEIFKIEQEILALGNFKVSPEQVVGCREYFYPKGIDSILDTIKNYPIAEVKEMSMQDK